MFDRKDRPDLTKCDGRGDDDDRCDTCGAATPFTYDCGQWLPTVERSTPNLENFLNRELENMPKKSRHRDRVVDIGQALARAMERWIPRQEFAPYPVATVATAIVKGQEIRADFEAHQRSVGATETASKLAELKEQVSGYNRQLIWQAEKIEQLEDDLKKRGNLVRELNDTATRRTEYIASLKNGYTVVLACPHCETVRADRRGAR